MPDADLARHVLAIQIAYPRIWFACHVEHRTRGAPHAAGITDREGGILAHIAAEAGIESGAGGGIVAADLARHLGIGKAALSQHLKRLRALGLVDLDDDADDRRRRRIRLTDAGRDAVSAHSPLDAGRLAALLRNLSDAEADTAVRGLQLLASAAQRLAGTD